MKVNYVQIKNFRSIKDSGKIYFNNLITIFAGKNESGKTNILKALHAFTEDAFDQDYDYPLEAEDGIYPEITVSISLDTKEALTLAPYLANSLARELIIVRSPLYVDVIKGEVYDSTLKDEDLKIEKHFNEIKEFFKKIDAVAKTSFVKPLLADKSEQNIKALLDQYLHNKNSYPPIEEEISDKFNFILNELLPAWSTLVNRRNEYIDKIYSLLPKFVYFDSFNDLIPDSISKGKDIDSEIVKRFFKVVNVKVEDIFALQNPQRRQNLANKISAQVTGDFMGYYSQDDVSLKINLDGDMMNFFVYGKDGEKAFQPKQRSQGLQWFLAFYLTLQAESSKNTVLMIDEPGLYLHAKAQGDLLKLLEKLSEVNQILMTTHSQWLIDPDRLERVRLVKKNDDYTMVENKIHKGADKDTLLPIMSAIGLDLSRSMTDFGDINVLVEGISDYYYLRAIIRYFENVTSVKDIRVFPSVGVTQISVVLSLLIGREAEYIIVVDNDKDGIKERTRLINAGIEENKIHFVIERQNGTIEDLFSEVDYHKYVLQSPLDSSESKTRRTASGLDKVMLAKRFNELVHEGKVKLDSETEKNCLIILGKILEKDLALVGSPAI
ncbi:ATP-dependent nuclease [Brevibacillus brevis]|uniref:ATP-dependent nuclease n=1 Tax=Brevibacillus brevis TaxID=1393 RepID=UPI0007D8A10B|nr:AAA family ATPase [Brevibacillus brevis]